MDIFRIPHLNTPSFGEYLMNRKIYILGSGLNMDPDGGIYPNLNSNGTDCRTNPHPVKTIGRFFFHAHAIHCASCYVLLNSLVLFWPQVIPWLCTRQIPSCGLQNYFTSCDPHHDIYTFSYWQIFWHSIWHIFWHSI